MTGVPYIPHRIGELRVKPEWVRLALHALSDLRAFGVDISQLQGVDGAIVEAVIEYEREQQALR